MLVFPRCAQPLHEADTLLAGNCPKTTSSWSLGSVQTRARVLRWWAPESLGSLRWCSGICFTGAQASYCTSRASWILLWQCWPVTQCFSQECKGRPPDLERPSCQLFQSTSNTCSLLNTQLTRPVLHLAKVTIWEKWNKPTCAWTARKSLI